MYRVAICDDESFFREYLKKLLINKLTLSKITLVEFVDGGDILNEIENGACFDLIFMDISMKEMDGTEAIRKIRTSSTSAEAIVIFISSYMADVSQIVELRPFAYIYKQDCEETLNDKIDSAFAVLEDGRDMVEFVCRHSHYRVRYHDIKYIESYRNNINIYTVNDTYITRSFNLTQLAKEIQSPKFIQCCSSAIVNYDYVKRFSVSTVEMEDGKIFSISRKYRKLL